mgnify:CR=1 FL=1
MKLQTQFTVPHKQLRDLDYVKEIEILEETLKKKCIDYPTQEDCLVCCDWLSIINFLLLTDFNSIHKFINIWG